MIRKKVPGEINIQTPCYYSQSRKGPEFTVEYEIRRNLRENAQLFIEAPTQSDFTGTLVEHFQQEIFMTESKHKKTM